MCVYVCVCVCVCVWFPLIRHKLVVQEGLVSRLSGGMCLDFSPRDPSAYLAGTEDGWVHLCSAGYSEQYLESVRAHNGPVYRVAYSPFWYASCKG